MHFIIEGNIFSIKVMCDANTTRNSFHKPDCFIHMLSTMFKGSNPFTTNNTKSSMKGGNMVKVAKGAKVKVLF